jgi:valyl-tRNA synthetase
VQYVEEARAQEREAREKLALVEQKIAQVSALKAAAAAATK